MRARGVRRTLTLSAAILIFVVLVGATYQGVSTAIERREYPHPGGLVPVGGHQLHLFCTGTGAPTVVLEAPALGTSAAWAWVTPLLSAQTRVCAYDRAGLGWSESDDGAYDPLRVPEELHLLLERANEARPVVLVGQGLGASFARLYAARFPADVRALVLIDPPAITAAPDDGVLRLLKASPWLARTGILRATRLLSNEAETLPYTSGAAMRAFLNRPDHLTRAAHELERWDDFVPLAAGVAVPPPIPVRAIAVAGQGRLALITTEAQARTVNTVVAEIISATSQQ